MITACPCPKPRHIAMRAAFFLSVFLIITSAASAHTLQGTVVTSNNEPLAGASVVLFASGNDSVAVTGTSSNEQGAYLLQAESGQYRLRASFIGMKTVWRDVSLSQDTRLDNIVMLTDTLLAHEVTVTARFIEHKQNGNLYVKIPGNPLAENSDGLQMLYKIPGVWGLNVYGRDIAAIYVNGRKLTMPRQAWSDYLKALDTSMIESYEFQPVAGSELSGDTNGSILYISLVKAPETGAQVTIDLSESYRFKQCAPTTSPSLNMAIGYKKFQSYTFFNYAHFGSNKANTESNRYYFDNLNDTTRYSSLSTKDFSGQNFIIDQSFAYEIDNDNLIEANFNGLIFPNRLTWGHNRTTYNDTGLDFGQYTNDTTLYNDANYGAYAAYTHTIDTLGSRLKASLEYTYLDQSSRQWTERQYTDSLHMLQTRYDYMAHGISPKIDFTFKPRNKISFNTGLQYLYTYRNNNFLQQETGYEDVVKPDNTKESIYSVYGNFIGQWGRLYTQAGIRIEYCDGIYRYKNGAHTSFDEWVFLPSASLQFTENAKLGHTLALYYSTYIIRPSAAYFDPTVYKYSEYTYMVGNADLKSAYIHSLQLRQTLWNSFNIVLSADWQLRNIETAFTPSPDDARVYTYKPINYGSTGKYQMQLSYGKQILPFWYINGNMSASYKSENSYNYGIQHSWGCNVSIYNQFNLPMGWAISLNAMYTKYERTYNYQADDHYSLSADVSKGFFDERLSLNFGFNNIICNERPIRTIYMDKYTSYEYNDMSQRHIYISLSYHFDIGKKDIKSHRVQTNGNTKSRF